MKIKDIYEPVFETCVRLIYDCSSGEAEKYMKKHYKESDSLLGYQAQTGTIERKNKDGGVFEHYYIYINKGSETIGVMVHELSHLVFYVFGKCGIKIPDREDSEVFAYYLEWWVNKVSKILKLNK